MNHAGDSAEFVCGIEANDSLRRSRHGNCDPFPLFQADRSERVGTLIDLVDELTVSRSVIEKIIGD